MTHVSVKICGLSTRSTMQAALDAGAAMVGLVSFPKSPRHVELANMRQLAEPARGRSKIVVLTVNADDGALADIVSTVRPDYIQLHGEEGVQRVAEVRHTFQTPLIKAVSVSLPSDIERARAFSRVADMVLLDAKPPKGASRPGGLGETFDWRLLDAIEHKHGFMLAGGLTIGNVRSAVTRTGISWVDVSSGVEHSPGEKDPEKIRAFIAAAEGNELAEPLKEGSAF
ncbi:MAG: phosphoribosylanthranilate isomerase [Pseudomonadota bacterium]